MERNLLFSRWLFGLAAALVSLGSSNCFAQLATEPNKLPSAEEFYPLVPGTRWDFSMTVNGVPSEVSYRVAEPEEVNGETQYRIDTLVQRRATSTEHLSHSEQGVVRHRFNGVPMNPPLVLLKNPVKVGESWETSLEVGGDHIEVQCEILAQEEVTVPAGEFQTLKVNVATVVNEMNLISTYWFAPQIGIVKQEIDLGEDRISIELTEHSRE